MKRSLDFLLAALVSVASFCVSSAAQTTGWPGYGGGADSDHYSSLAQINRGNVGQLKLAWRFETGEKGDIQTNPLIIGDTLYAYTPGQKVIALDAATGKLKWKFDSGIRGTQPARGLAYWTEENSPAGSQHARIFAGIMSFLYCLDAETGKPVAGFGENGRIDLRKNLRGDYRDQSVVLTSPGMVYKNLIIVGGRNPETHPAPPGDIRAYDVRTGALRWVFHTIPHPGQPGYETWPPGAWKTAGAANNWAGMSLDVARGIVYVPTGSAVMDFYGGDRIGNDLYADSLLALDAATGKLLWHFQEVHHDLWDRDLPAPPALYTVERNGDTIPALAQITKQGYIYLFNRLDGEPLFPVHEHPYPASTVPGEKASPTQPAPDWPLPFARQRLTEEMLTNRTPAAHAAALGQFRTFRSDGQFVPFSLEKQTVVFPGFDGGGEWGGPALDPVADVLFVSSTEMAWTGGLVRASRAATPGEQIYQQQCAVCHGINREGSPPTFPSLVGITQRLSIDKITDTIHLGSGRMPSFPDIKRTELSDLLAYLRTAPNPGERKELHSATLRLAQPSDTEGAAVYQKRCGVCHGEHREGVPPSFPALVGIGSRMTAQQITTQIHHGKGRMPPMPDLQGAPLQALLQFLGAGAEKHVVRVSSDPYAFTGYRKFLDSNGYPAIAPPWGTLNALDLKTGKYLWKIPLGEYPELVRQGVTNTGSELYGGPIVTAGGVLFIGASVYDRKFRAFDSSTGRLLWETQLPFAGIATPATYMVNGRQYVVIAASGGRDPHGPVGGSYIAFALPK